MSRTKKIARLTNPGHQLTAPATQLLTFCAEYVAKIVLKRAEEEARRHGSKVIGYQHIQKVVYETPGLAFLEDVVPEKLVVGGQQEEANE